jgi:hypothetical protein
LSHSAAVSGTPCTKTITVVSLQTGRVVHSVTTQLLVRLVLLFTGDDSAADYHRLVGL